MNSNETQREFAVEIVRQLRAAGFEALWAGGCVRDQVLGRSPQDYDVATNARPEEIRSLFGKRRTLALGAAFGVITVLGGKGREPIEVATFRSDGAYLDGRHPSSVVFTTADHDAQRRDFTINGLFFDPLTDAVIDYVGGKADLAAGIVRAIGDPAARFAEDKLRLLRAVRFATTFGFSIEPATFAAIRAMAGEVAVVSAERIGAELERLLTHPRRANGVRLLAETGLLQALLPEVAPHAEACSPEWIEMLNALERLQSDELATVLGALFFRTVEVRQVGTICRRIRFSNKTTDLTKRLVQHVPRIGEAQSLPWPQVQRILVHEGAGELVKLGRAIWGDTHAGVQFCAERLTWPAERLNPPPLVTGDDLIRQGLQPGRHFVQLLDAVRDAQLEGRISTETEAMEMVAQLIR